MYKYIVSNINIIFKLLTTSLPYIYLYPPTSMKLPDSKKILAELANCTTEDQLKTFFSSYLGKK